MAKRRTPFGPLPDHPDLDRLLAASYACLHDPAVRTPAGDVWLVIRSLIKAARAADNATTEEVVEALSASLGEVIADLPAAKQQALVEVMIHEAFQFAAQLRTPGFDQPHGMAGHA